MRALSKACRLTAVLLLSLAAAPAQKRDKSNTINIIKELTPAQSALVDKAILREQAITQALKDRTPMVETYIQVMTPDLLLRQVPQADQHFLGRIEFGKVIGFDPYQQAQARANAQKYGKPGVVKESLNALSGLAGVSHLSFSPAGFAQMLLIDYHDFDRQHYNFFFVRNDFLGSVPTTVFDVTPALKNSTGRFFGRIWIETAEANIIRFNGEYAGSQKDFHEYAHFDSWRTNVQPNLWLPNSTYIEDVDQKSKTGTLNYKATNHVWGYALKLPTEVENTSIDVQNATDISNEAQDQSPLTAQRALARQAEDNILDRLFQAGLLNAPGPFDQALADLANNILAYNNLPVLNPIRVRTLLTEPLESVCVGNTILLSKSLLDTTAILSANGVQQTANLNALLAFQLAHILAGHHLDTKYAFNSRLMFPDNLTFRRIPMHHSDADNVEAAAKAIQLLQAPELANSGKFFGLYLQQLQLRLAHLPNLTQPLLGDGLVKSDLDRTFWLAPLVAQGELLSERSLNQQAAASLSSFLASDPWTGQILPLHRPLEPLLAPSDKMPFEVQPIYLQPRYFEPPNPSTTPNNSPPGAPLPQTLYRAPPNELQQSPPKAPIFILRGLPG